MNTGIPLKVKAEVTPQQSNEETDHAMFVGSCHVYDCNQHLTPRYLEYFLLRSEKTLYPAGLVGIDRLERHLGLDIDDIVARQHSN